MSIVNRRFDAVCRREGGPFFSASVTCEAIVRSCEAHCVEVTPYQGRVADALRGALTELARLRAHGFSVVRPPALLTCYLPLVFVLHAGGFDCATFQSDVAHGPFEVTAAAAVECTGGRPQSDSRA